MEQMMPDAACGSVHEVNGRSGHTAISHTEANKLGLSYVLVTPARDEAAFIEKTIQSVIAQTIRPLRWVIVSDGSTDGMVQIAERCASEHPWIEVIQMPERAERHFAGKVRAFEAGYDRVKGLNYDFIGSLDGDVSFGPDYFEYLLEMSARNPKIGLAGTNYCEEKLRYDYRYSNIEDVPGACQLFRRDCFEAIGGYQPIKAGGVDLVAVLRARMEGWETRTFTDRHLIHHRPQGTATAKPWVVHFRDGQHDYRFGGHPLWEAFRGCYRMTQKPFVMGGFLLLAGYIWSACTGTKRPVSPELIQFRRREQMRRLRHFCKRVLASRVKLMVTLGCATTDTWAELWDGLAPLL